MGNIPRNIEHRVVALELTHWGRVMHTCISKLIIIGSDNGLSPGWCQADIWTNAGILLIGHSWTNFSEILIKIHTFSFRKMHFIMSFEKWQQFCLCLNVLILMEMVYFVNHQFNPKGGSITASISKGFPLTGAVYHPSQNHLLIWHQ